MVSMIPTAKLERMLDRFRAVEAERLERVEEELLPAEPLTEVDVEAVPVWSRMRDRDSHSPQELTLRLHGGVGQVAAGGTSLVCRAR